MSCAVDTYYFLLPSVAATVLNYPSPSPSLISTVLVLVLALALVIALVLVLSLSTTPDELTRKNNLRFMSSHIPSFAQGAAQQQ
jgi:hypothetical protein